ncbi:DUF2459 domain-containing protein [Erythrobacter arachoides]|uniref:DUF2459 domain-containing protein n=1 Tax=Aurantiacibacter arachoides TaxID=1850444 RepID=A0A844ZYQ9_9SPHN|nr:DUF2459 domain-containing protein [Aurantiacibacter arachoides]MXO93421.1 DUF2459 domain-containing protein [Aurantiacibacter arachoides]GGD49518.1 hypothetical protein GCM10011411_06610 [Aurantiacibacter arachoides]
MIRRAIRVVLGTIAVLGGVVAAYLLAGWVGSSLPRNTDWQQPAEGVVLLVETNGTHTGIVVPVANAIKDWRETFPNAGRVAPFYGEMPTHLAIGYGEREVFLGVPTWSDLSLATVLRIASVGGEAVIRVSPYVRPAPGDNYRPITITQTQYRRLVTAIERELPAIAAGADRRELRGTYALDSYYEALGSYSLVNTCNSWVGARLAEAGLPMGRWTPMAGGVMKWIPRPANIRQAT